MNKYKVYEVVLWSTVAQSMKELGLVGFYTYSYSYVLHIVYTNSFNRYMLFTGREVRMEKKKKKKKKKTVHEVLSTARGRRLRTVLKTKGTVFFFFPYGPTLPGK